VVGPVALTYKEVDRPITGECASGHIASETFCSGGPGSDPEATRFFRLTGCNIKGEIYCEPCLIVMNWMLQQRKKGK
jgi:hypothetical protein